MTSVPGILSSQGDLAEMRAVGRYTLILELVTISCILTCPFWLGALFFTSPRDYSYTSSLICVPLLAAMGAVTVAHLTQRDPYLRRLLGASLVAHMAVSSLFLWMGFYIYGASVDAFHYWTVGGQLTRDFSLIGWSAFHSPWWSTNLINNICGMMMLLIGDGLPTLFISFALLGLWGGYLFYRAFTTAFPEGDRWLFGLLMFLSPSVLFWSSSLGKDALAQLFVGLTCYGFVRLNRQAGPRAVLLCALGLGGVLLVRAHVAAMLALAMTFPYVVGRPAGKQVNPAVRLLIIPVLIAGTYFLVTKAEGFLGVDSQSSTSSVEKLNNLAKNNQIGGGAFNEESSLTVRMAESPVLIFRPFPWEAHSVMAAVASLEATGWLLLCVLRRKPIWLALKEWRDPNVGFILVYSAIFSLAFAAAGGNFGIVVRQRIMMVPVALMLTCIHRKSTVARQSVRSRAPVQRSFLASSRSLSSRR